MYVRKLNRKPIICLVYALIRAKTSGGKGAETVVSPEKYRYNGTIGSRPPQAGQISGGGHVHMSIRAGINGFGRIGRLAFRAGIERGCMDFVAVNAPDKTPEQLAYLFKYDSVHGRYEGDVDFDDENLIVNGKPIRILDSRKVEELPWGKLGVDYVMECTGKFLTREKCLPHLNNGAKIVRPFILIVLAALFIKTLWQYLPLA